MAPCGPGHSLLYTGCGGLFEVVSVRLGRPVEVQCGIENPPPLLAKHRPTKRPPNPADCFGRNVRNVRNVFGAVCFAHTGVSGTSVSVRHEFCVAVRVDLLKVLSHYVKCIAKSFNISVLYIHYTQAVNRRKVGERRSSPSEPEVGKWVDTGAKRATGTGI